MSQWGESGVAPGAHSVYAGGGPVGLKPAGLFDLQVREKTVTIVGETAYPQESTRPNGTPKPLRNTTEAVYRQTSDMPVDDRDGVARQGPLADGTWDDLVVPV